MKNDDKTMHSLINGADRPYHLPGGKPSPGCEKRPVSSITTPYSNETSLKKSIAVSSLCNCQSVS